MSYYVYNNKRGLMNRYLINFTNANDESESVYITASDFIQAQLNLISWNAIAVKTINDIK